MIISERIFELLSEKGMSQKEFANMTGIPQSTISDWKGKKVNPASDKIMIICDVLKVSPYELLSGTESDNYQKPDYAVINKNSDEYYILESTRKLKESQRKRLIGYMEALLEDNNKRKK